MPVSIVAIFVVVFALVVLAAGVAMKYYETRRKRHVTGMLQTVAGAEPMATAKILKDLEPPKPSPAQRILTSLNMTRRAQEQLQQAGLPWSPGRLLTMTAFGAGAGVLAGTIFPVLLNGFVTALALAAIGGFLPLFNVRRKRAKRMAMMEEQLPEGLDFLARSMRAGHAFTISLGMVGEELAEPLGQEFRSLFNEQNLGAPLEIALRNFTERVPLLDVRFFSSSVLLQRQTGGNLAEILNRLSYVIRERFRLKGQVKAASAHGRMTAGILTALPICTMLGLLVVAPGYLQGMAADPDGKYIIAGAVLAQILGNFCIKKIINIKV
jgi:tight adherence protein B